MDQIKRSCETPGLEDVYRSPLELTRAVLQISQMLGIYDAELARILHLQCADIGDLNNARKNLEKHSTAWQQAEKLILLYQSLHQIFSGNEALMHHWLTRKLHEDATKHR